MAAKFYRKLLQIVSDVDGVIIGEDEEGHAFTFHKDEVPVHIINEYEGSVHVTYRAGDIEPVGSRRLEKLRPKEQKVTRTCINCGHQFKTDQDYRVCIPCKTGDDWRYGDWDNVHEWSLRL